MRLKGVGIGREMAAGKVLRMGQPIAEPNDTPRSSDESVEEVMQNVQNALRTVSEYLKACARAALKGDEAGKKAAAIMQALAQIAIDPALYSAINNSVLDGKTAARAVWEGFAGFEETLRSLGGYVAERVRDLHDICQRVIAILLGVEAPGIPESDEPFVLVAQDISPADTASLDLTKVLAVITSEGGPTSHTAILARARGIVAVVGVKESSVLQNNQMVLVDAANGVVIADPTEDELESLREARKRKSRAKDLRGMCGCTSDGHKIPLLANVGTPEGAGIACEYGAEGVGLFRTEFLFIGNEKPPSIDEQTDAYVSLLSKFEGKQVVIRLLDAGADKPLPFLASGNEPNPALGLRGLRTLCKHRDVLEGQLEALSRANAVTNSDLCVMAPMVADEQETEYFVKLGKSKGLKKVGIMAEVPSIAFMADEVAQIADFISIGTNDLTQYLLAADRTLGSVANYQTTWHPAVLRAIKMIVDAGKLHNTPVCVCGEAAADPNLAVVLVGLGVTSLSMTPAALDDVRFKLSNVTLQQAYEQACAALSGEWYSSVMQD